MKPRIYLLDRIQRAFFYLLPVAIWIGCTAVGWGQDVDVLDANNRPNILFAIADDWGWPHAGAYGDAVIKTPVFDRIAREGMLCHQAFVSSPSCTPSRGAILSGMYHWQLGPASNLYGPFPDSISTYPELLAKAGYRIGKSRKCWGPGVPQTKGRELGGANFAGLKEFLTDESDQPFCFWLGSFDPHRPYKPGTGEDSGIDLEKVHLFDCFPDNRAVRSDIADYYFAVQRFDALVGQAIDLLEEKGLLDNTIVVITGDHGMPFPRCKGNLYDSGTRVPLAIRYPPLIKAGSKTQSLISLVDLAPTFLELGHVPVPQSITGNSLRPVFADPNYPIHSMGVTFGKERHCPAQEKPVSGGYPCRALRTPDFLYIRNYYPDRWPSGTPNWREAWFRNAWLGDSDNGPTKNQIADMPDSQSYQLCFAKRPGEELYDLKSDPQQMNNLADDPKYQRQRRELQSELDRQQQLTNDPRYAKPFCDLDDYQPYTGGSPKYPDQEGK